MKRLALCLLVGWAAMGGVAQAHKQERLTRFGADAQASNAAFDIAFSDRVQNGPHYNTQTSAGRCQVSRSRYTAVCHAWVTDTDTHQVFARARIRVYSRHHALHGAGYIQVLWWWLD